MTNYIGLTIGPIYKTLQNARKTRELWAASYIFSHIMKQLIKAFRTRTFIIPYVPLKDENDPVFEKLLNKAMPIGVFHDRFIFRAEDGDFALLQKEIRNVLDTVADGMAKKLGANYTDIKKYVHQYFQLYCCEKAFKEGANFKTISKAMNTYLDTLELQSAFIPSEKENYVAKFLKNANNSFLIEAAFDKPKIRFRSIPEIATFSLGLQTLDAAAHRDIFETFDKEEDKTGTRYDIYQDIKTRYQAHKISLKKHHRYIAIVHADGDGMGNAIENLPNDPAFRSFSKQLFTFDLKADVAIRNFGGETIFAGGDDLLFFAPVTGNDGTVFDLINKLDGIFKDLFKTFNPNPTLSFGVSISYYKFPLYEALNLSRELLVDVAKEKKRGKNAVAFRLLKHSGQYFEGFYPKPASNSEFQALIGLLNATGDDKLMSGVIHTLFAQKPVLQAVGDDSIKLSNFFENNFNEPIHKTYYKAQLDKVREMTLLIMNSPVYHAPDNPDLPVATIYSTLRLNKFIREEAE